MEECPNHEGAFDCTPFCSLCEGEQFYYPLPSYSMLTHIRPSMLSEERKEKLKGGKRIW